MLNNFFKRELHIHIRLDEYSYGHTSQVLSCTGYWWIKFINCHRFIITTLHTICVPWAIKWYIILHIKISRGKSNYGILFAGTTAHPRCNRFWEIVPNVSWLGSLVMMNPFFRCTLSDLVYACGLYCVYSFFFPSIIE
jgi:hypothetical protein